MVLGRGLSHVCDRVLHKEQAYVEHNRNERRELQLESCGIMEHRVCPYTVKTQFKH
jgi:hypothetical protein